MKIIVAVRAEKAPKDKEELAFLAEIHAKGKLEEWRRESEDALRVHLKSELDDPDVLDVSVTVEEDSANLRRRTRSKFKCIICRDVGCPDCSQRCPYCGNQGTHYCPGPKPKAALHRYHDEGTALHSDHVCPKNVPGCGGGKAVCDYCRRYVPQPDPGVPTTEDEAYNTNEEPRDCIYCGNDPEYRERCTGCGGGGKEAE